MYYENGLLRLFTSDIPKELRGLFLNATRAYGWKRIAQGVWAGEEQGGGRVSIEGWLEIQKSHIKSGDIINALGFTREGFRYHAIIHGLKPVINGKHKPQDVAEFLKKIDRFAPCPACGGMGVSQSDGSVMCLPPKGVQNEAKINH